MFHSRPDYNALQYWPTVECLSHTWDIQGFQAMRFYSGHAWVCAKWHWNARRTSLCYRIARPVKPGVQSSNTSRVRFTVISHTPMRSHFYHTHIMYKRNWDGFCLVNLIYFALHIFQIRNLLHCVDESWWNMPFNETRLGDGVAEDAVAMLLPLWLHAAALWRHSVWIRIVTSHNAWMAYEYSLQNLNRPRGIHKHNPHPFETMDKISNTDHGGSRIFRRYNWLYHVELMGPIWGSVSGR